MEVEENKKAKPANHISNSSCETTDSAGGARISLGARLEEGKILKKKTAGACGKKSTFPGQCLRKAQKMPRGKICAQGKQYRSAYENTRRREKK